MRLNGLDAEGLAALLQERAVSCVEVGEALLGSVREDALGAWASVDGERLIASARALDALAPDQRTKMPLYGLPVGVKDNFDTSDHRTTYGSPIYAAHRPAADAEAVRRLRAAGALFAGKTKLTEFAWMHPTDTISPIDAARTPGGSSSGSAVAVAAGHVPLALGTQTAGSVNRPASYCAVVGYKPTFGVIDRAGIKLMSSTLDTVGVFARTVNDARLLARPLAREPWLRGPAGDGARVAFARTPIWDRVESEAREAIERVTAELESVDLPDGFSELLEAHAEIQLHDGARALAAELRDHAELLSDELREALAAGAVIPADRHRHNLGVRRNYGSALMQLLARYDGVVVPSTTGVPPLGRGYTGDPLFSRAWTLIGAPSISLPLAWTGDGLPVGLQLVGAPHRDGELLTAAARLQDEAGLS